MNRRAWRVLLACALLAAAGFWLAAHPVHLPARGPVAQASFPRRDSGHPVLLAVAWETYKGHAPRAVRDRPADLEWDNLLTQAWGGCDVLTAEELARDPATALQGRSLLVLPRRTLAQLPASLLTALRPFVQQGLLVLLEAPPAAWADGMGLAFEAEETAPELTWPPASRSAPRALDLPEPEPPPLPLPATMARYAPGTSARSMARPIVDLGGRPAVWRLDEGGGSWLIVAMDFGALALALRQGDPGADFHLLDRYREVLPKRLQTDDLVASAALLQADQPWLDAWIAALFDVESANGPWATVWPARFESDGWLLLADEADPSARAPSAADAAAAPGGDAAEPASWLLASTAAPWTAGRVDSLRAARQAVGLRAHMPVPSSWNDPTAPRSRLGLGGWRPLARLRAPREQRAALLATWGADESTRVLLKYARSADRLWSRASDQSWGWLVDAGLRADASYGPGPTAGGWLYGSTAPFRPLDRRGLSYSLWELPSIGVAGSPTIPVGRLDRWLRGNALGGHGPILLVHERSNARAAATGTLWASAVECAVRRGHALATLPELVAFWELRSRVHARWAYDYGELHVHVEAPPGTARAALALALPLHWRRTTLRSWEASWSGAESRRATSFGRPQRLIVLPDGSGELTAVYH